MTAPRPVPRVSLNGFHVLPENRSAVRAVKALARSVLLKKRVAVCPLVLHGPTGCGKSHLTSAIVAALASGDSDVVARSEAAGDLARPDSLGADAGFADRNLQTCDVLVLEDVQHLPERAADAVCDLLDKRARRRKACIITANTGPAGLTLLPRRLTSRLAAGLVVQLEPLTEASRRSVIESAAKARTVRLTADGLEALATHGTSIRSALGLLQNLAQVAAKYPGPLDRKAVEEILSGTGQPTSRAVPLDAIMKRVASMFGVSVKELLGTSRLRNVVLARQVAMYLAREVVGLSLPRIGTAFGRDHTTVLHSCRKVESEMETDAALRGRVNELRRG